MVTGYLLATLLAVVPAQAVVLPTQAELFADRLDIDRREQGPALQQTLETGNAAAGPVAQEMMQIRQELVNLALQGMDMTEALARYADAASRMAGIEANAFREILSQLRDNQRRRAPEAFQIMGGIFLPVANAAGGGGRGRGGE